jgi:hypothetical protein
MLKSNLKINKQSRLTESDLLGLYTKAEESANNDRFGRGGSNEVWSQYESALSRWEKQTGENSGTMGKKIKNMYEAKFKKSRGSAGPTGMTPTRDDM